MTFLRCTFEGGCWWLLESAGYVTGILMHKKASSVFTTGTKNSIDVATLDVEEEEAEDFDAMLRN
ncbi:hypothetical protein CTI12_AA169780 [Artemisia annua]|uniref:Uncharacterized protein n=1 Tax=Artemisia annua TaxID=35608 RepID=A0A2U1PBE1_ARTAN|nr:hypothetical protein CTI12_AA169780 [Artemisia annua]